MVQCHKTKADAGNRNRINVRENAADKQLINCFSILKMLLNDPAELLRFEKCIFILKIMLTRVFQNRLLLTVIKSRDVVSAIKMRPRYSGAFLFMALHSGK
jgi:hypothetical protein